MEPIKIIALVVSSFAVGWNLCVFVVQWQQWKQKHKSSTGKEEAQDVSQIWEVE